MKRCFWPLVGFVVVVLGSVKPCVAGVPMTRDQLLKLSAQGVDPSILASLVARDCVDFEVSADNVAELSKLLPKEVIQAALACRRRTTGGATPSPTAAPPPRADAPPEFGAAMEVCKPAGEGDLTPDHGKKMTCYGTLTVDNAGLSFKTARCARHLDDDDFEIAWSSLKRICVRPGEKGYLLELVDTQGTQHSLKLDPAIPWADQAWSESYDRRKTACEADVTKLLGRIREREPQVEVPVRCP